MKHFKLIAVILALMLFLTACGGSKIPEGFTKESYSLGCQALDLMEKYNNSEIEADECYISLKGIYEEANKIHDDNTQSREVQLNALAIAANCFDFNNRLLTGDSDTKEPVEYLKKTLKME